MDEIRAGVAQYTGIAAKCRHRDEMPASRRNAGIAAKIRPDRQKVLL